MNTKMKFNLLVAALASSAALSSTAFASNDGRPEKPNVLLLLADDLGWQDVKCYDIDESSPYETPNIDAFSKKGVMFWQGYSAAPLCAPSRAALLCGMHPARTQKTSVRGGTPPAPYHTTGMRVMPPWHTARMSTKQASLAEVLHSNGYATGHSGKWHVNIKPTAYPLPHDVGFEWSRESMGVARDMKPNRIEGFSSTSPDDFWQINPEGYAKNGIFDDSVIFMEEYKDKPFFLYCAPRLVHSPIQTRSKVLLEKYCTKLGIPFPEDAGPMARPGQQNPYYCAMVDEFDYYVGTLFDYLEATDDPRWPGHKLSENIYIIFSSDNGGMEKLKGDIITDNYPLDGGKLRLEEGGTRVPLIITGPSIAANTQSDVMINGLDFFPTILSMTGTEAPAANVLDGCDLYPMLLKDPTDPTLVKEKDGSARDSMMWHFPNSSAMQSAYRVGDYKLVRNHDYIGNPKIKNELELYRLYKTVNGKSVRVDIEEAKDLASSMPEKAEALDAELTKILTKMGASYPNFNPAYTGELPHKETVPAFTSEKLVGNVAKAQFVENGAKVVRAQLSYTVLGEDVNEEWFIVPATIDGDTVEATLPEGTTHYVFNIIDENDFLVSYPELKSQQYYKGKPKYSETAFKVAR